jgi:hypothetical protein
LKFPAEAVFFCGNTELTPAVLRAKVNETLLIINVKLSYHYSYFDFMF